MPQIISEADLEPVDPAIRRKQVTGNIDEIARLTKQSMAANGLTLPIGLLVPSSGQALLTITSTTEPDPTDDEWERVCDIVIGVAEKVLGIKGLISREVFCSLVQAGNA